MEIAMFTRLTFVALALVGIAGTTSAARGDLVSFCELPAAASPLC